MSQTIHDVIHLLSGVGKACISMTGGGGKTTFLVVLGEALRSVGYPVILTTTTKVQKPFPVSVDWFISDEDSERLKKEIMFRTRPNTLGMAVRGPFGDHKWNGIEPEIIDNIFALIDEGFILNEADGAFRLPIKAPAEHEPVIPQSTTILFPVLGLMALGTPLDKAHAFRPQLIAKVTGLSMGDRITKEAMATLFIHPEGITKDAPKRSLIIPFLNQADTPELWEAGRRIAVEIFRRTKGIVTVIIGRLQPHPSFEICHRNGPFLRT